MRRENKKENEKTKEKAIQILKLVLQEIMRFNRL